MKIYSISLIFMTLLAASNAVRVNNVLSEEWKAFKLKYEKVYENEMEETFRRMIFIDNWHKIEKHNELYEKGFETFTMGMNRFGDMLNYERVSIMNGYKRMNVEHRLNVTTFIKPENVEAPASIDWVKKGYVTPVKNQGDCGSCWSFSATGGMEGQYKRKSGKLVSLSEQNLIDCSSKYGNSGCEGGDLPYAYNYIKANKGVDTEESYPYEGVDAKCRFKISNVGASCSGYASVKTGSEKRMQKAVGTVGPLSIAIDASHESFGFYKDGVYNEKKCSSEDLDHAVLVTGYDKYDGKDFWMVKNSWGTDWGVKGYIRMSRNKNNQCGVATEATYPLM